MIRLICKDKVFSDIQAIFFDKDGKLEDSRIYLHQLVTERIRLLSPHKFGIADHLPKTFGFNAGKIDPKGLMAVGSRKDNELAAAALIASSGCGWYQAKEVEPQQTLMVGDSVGDIIIAQQAVTRRVPLAPANASFLSYIGIFIPRNHLRPMISRRLALREIFGRR